jgi:hypothetical protein
LNTISTFAMSPIVAAGLPLMTTRSASLPAAIVPMRDEDRLVLLRCRSGAVDHPDVRECDDRCVDAHELPDLGRALLAPRHGRHDGKQDHDQQAAKSGHAESLREHEGVTHGPSWCPATDQALPAASSTRFLV